MPKQWTSKDERQYQHVKESERKRGRSPARAKEIAARTVNKQRRQEGRTANKSTQGTGNPNVALEERVARVVDDAHRALAEAAHHVVLADALGCGGAGPLRVQRTGPASGARASDGLRLGPRHRDVAPPRAGDVGFEARSPAAMRVPCSNYNARSDRCPKGCRRPLGPMGRREARLRPSG